MKTSVLKSDASDKQLAEIQKISFFHIFLPFYMTEIFNLMEKKCFRNFFQQYMYAENHLKHILHSIHDKS